jgi:hypothetical protein
MRQSVLRRLFLSCLLAFAATGVEQQAAFGQTPAIEKQPPTSGGLWSLLILTPPNTFPAISDLKPMGPRPAGTPSRLSTPAVKTSGTVFAATTSSGKSPAVTSPSVITSAGQILTPAGQSLTPAGNGPSPVQPLGQFPLPTIIFPLPPILPPP